MSLIAASTAMPGVTLAQEVGQSSISANPYLEMSLADLMNIQVTSVSKTQQRVADAPAAITVITQDDIAQSGLREIPEILRLAPGLAVQHSNTQTGWSVSSRGFGETFVNKLLVLQDGRTVYLPYQSCVYWDTVDYPIADLDRVEVIRGPGATLWGANAVNGVINIISKNAKDTQGLLVDTRVGTDESTATVRYGGALDPNTHYRIYAKGRDFDDLSPAMVPNGEENQWDDMRSGFRIDRNIDGTDALTLQGDTYYQSVSNPGLMEIPVENYTHDYHSGANILGRWTHTFSDSSETTLQMFYDRVNQRDAFADYHLNVYDIDFQHRFELTKGQEIIYGLGFRYVMDRIERSTLPQPMVDPNEDDFWLANGFLQYTLTVVPRRLNLILGSKVEVNKFTGLEVQPTVRLLWTPSEKTSVWAAVSRATRTPSRWQHDSSYDRTMTLPDGSPAAMRIYGNNLNSEDMLAWEMGYRQQVTEAFSFDASVFANQYQSLIAMSIMPSYMEQGVLIKPTYWENAGSAESYGFELAANWQITKNWRLRGSYSLLEAYMHFGDHMLRFPEPAMEQAAPVNQAQIHSSYSISRDLDLNASAYYVDSTLGSSMDYIPPYFRTDLGVNWRPARGLEVSLGAQNAFDPSHQETGGQMGTAQVGRSVYLQMTWRW